MNNTEKKTTHKSVLVDEVLTYLDPQPGKLYIDATFGGGGHTRAILDREPNCRVIGIDWDAISLEGHAFLLQHEYGDRFIPIWGNFAHLYKLMKKQNIKSVDGILADFGTSQMQIFDRDGFSLYRDTPLDMRMSTSHKHETAATVVNQAKEQELSYIFWHYGEERSAKKIARLIVQERSKRPLTTTGELVALVEQVIPMHGGRRIHPATKVFQALRMYVNKEEENIIAFLPAALSLLAPHGRFVCISFHSLEDRLVKYFFKEKEQLGQLQILTKKVVTASEQELKRNPSSRSAKLRAAQVALDER
jgi:16S rRNA (cytosine1402-N4)-methyltransferase